MAEMSTASGTPDLEARLDALPARAGVYLLRDRHGKVIYVGKAKSLRQRVRAYFRGGDERAQVRFLVSKLASFETLVTANEKEALILENNLIKQGHRTLKAPIPCSGLRSLAYRTCRAPS